MKEKCGSKKMMPGLQNRVDEINKEIRKIVYRVKKDSTYTSQIYPLVLMIYYGTAAWKK